MTADSKVSCSTNNGPLIGSSTEFERFIARFDNPVFRSRVSHQTALTPAETDAALDMYFAEMRFGHAFLQTRVPHGRLRILEIGAGLGILSLYLAHLGHEVTAVEPAAESFELFEVTKQLIREQAESRQLTLLEIGAEELDPTRHGRFDFVFSINVLEHIQPLDNAFRAITEVMRDSAIGLHMCANYAVPYEPHFAIPLIPFLPKLSRRLFRKQIEPRAALWESLNFVSVRKVKSMATGCGAAVAFEKNVTYLTFKRLAEDVEFMKRHSHSVVGRTYALLARCRMLEMLKLLPTALNTPMIFRVSRREASNG